MTMNRAYSLLKITKADAEQRIIEGIASTPETDRVGDIVEPRGARFNLPLPLLFQHRHDEPIGHVEWARPEANGIPFRARLVKVTEPGRLRDRLEEAWQSIRAGLIRAVSIGFQPLDAEPIATGFRFKTWNWYELSVCTIPANESATIQTVKRLAASAKPCRVVRLSDPNPAANKPFVIRKIHRTNASRTDSARPVASAIGAELDRHAALREEAARRKALGPVNSMLIDMLAAGTKATDAELTELRARLARLEGKG